jgi:hypothetical protein
MAPIATSGTIPNDTPHNCGDVINNKIDPLRDEFIDLLMGKLSEGLVRQRDNAIRKIAKIDETKFLLKEKNKQSEQSIIKKIH